MLNSDLTLIFAASQKMLEKWSVHISLRKFHNLFSMICLCKRQIRARTEYCWPIGVGLAPKRLRSLIPRTKYWHLFSTVSIFPWQMFVWVTMLRSTSLVFPIQKRPCHENENAKYGFYIYSIYNFTSNRHIVYCCICLYITTDGKKSIYFYLFY